MEEWKGSSHQTAWTDPKGCVTCHMPEVERPLAENQPVRKARSHSFRATSNPNLLKRGLILAVAVEGDKVVARLTSKEVGHMAPTGDDRKQLVVELVLAGAQEIPAGAVVQFRPWRPL